MKKSCLMGAVCACISILCFHPANAASIIGDIAFGTAIGASWTPADNLLNTGPSITTLNADGVKFSDGISASPIDEGVVTNAFGDYAGTLGSFVDFNDFVFNPLIPNTQLWAFNSGLTSYSFSMSAINIVSQTSNTISLEGTGIASVTGLDDTSGEFSLTLNQNGQAFSFSSSASVVPVPAAVWLFGSGLLGLVGIARRKKSA
ncbi:MAG: VPLPA-CTERM sorting domain-containing protein [Gammaproteobacteria bacterium]|nr:MAG: VPLPA-CTERM sorting domain-containing protein [Gammaproteobacteria bacterium]